MSAYNRLDLQTLRSQPVIPKNLPEHWNAENMPTWRGRKGDPPHRHVSVPSGNLVKGRQAVAKVPIM